MHANPLTSDNVNPSSLRRIDLGAIAAHAFDGLGAMSAAASSDVRLTLRAFGRLSRSLWLGLPRGERRRRYRALAAEDRRSTALHQEAARQIRLLRRARRRLGLPPWPQEPLAAADLATMRPNEIAAIRRGLEVDSGRR